MDYCYTAAIVRKFSASGAFSKINHKKTNVTGGLLLDCYLERKARQRLPSAQVVLLQGKKWEGTKAAITTTKKTNKPCSALRFCVLSRWTSLVDRTFLNYLFFAVVLLLVRFKVTSAWLCTAPRIASIRPTLTTSNTPSEPIRFLRCSSNIRCEG